MVDLNKYHQPSPDMNEGRPEKIERNEELLYTKKKIIECMPCLHKGKILDVGPACGWELKRIKETHENCEVEAVTLFEEEKTEIQKNVPGSIVYVNDMHNLPLDWKGKYDMVFASHVLEHSPAPFIALSEFHRVLGGCGFLTIVLPDPNGYTGLYGLTPRRIGDFKAHLFCPSIDTMIEMGRHAGFTFIEYMEIPQYCQKNLHYYNRVFNFERDLT